jgi:FAD/FMN-containing dehydrogenase
VPAWVVRPADVGEVRACVARAERDGMVIVPTGLGAHLDVGGPPARADVLLRLDRLARVVDHQAADMTVTVEGRVSADHGSTRRSPRAASGCRSIRRS